MDDPIAAVRRFRDAFGAGTSDRRLDHDAGADAFVEVIAPYAADDFVCVMVGGALNTTYEGLEGMRRGWQDFQNAFETIQIEPGEMQLGPTGSSVLEFVTLRGRPVGVAAEVEQAAAAVWRFAGGRLRMVEFHIDRDAALRSVESDQV